MEEEGKGWGEGLGRMRESVGGGGMERGWLVCCVVNVLL